MAIDAVRAFNSNWAMVGGIVMEEDDGSAWDAASVIVPTSSNITVLPLLKDTITEGRIMVATDAAQNSPEVGPGTEIGSLTQGALSYLVMPTSAGRTALRDLAQWGLGLKNASGVPSKHKSLSYWAYGNDMLSAYMRSVVCLSTTIRWSAAADASNFLVAEHSVVAYGPHTSNNATAATWDKTDGNASWEWRRQDPFTGSGFSCTVGPAVTYGTGTLDLSADITSVEFTMNRGIDVQRLLRGGTTRCADPRNQIGNVSYSLSLGVQPGDALEDVSDVLAFLRSTEPMRLRWSSGSSSIGLVLGSLDIPDEIVRSYEDRDSLTPLALSNIPATASTHGMIDALSVYVDDVLIDTTY